MAKLGNPILISISNCYAGLVGLQSPRSARHVSDPHRQKAREAIAQPAEMLSTQRLHSMSQLLISTHKTGLALIGLGRKYSSPTLFMQRSRASIEITIGHHIQCLDMQMTWRKSQLRFCKVCGMITVMMHNALPHLKLGWSQLA